MPAVEFLIVGLGNPGLQYRSNRHNIGFRVVEELAHRLGLVFEPGGQACLAAGPAAVKVGDFLSTGVVLLKPQAYMNRSGEALLQWAQAEGVPLHGPDGMFPADGGLAPLVVCDDLNLPLGSVRLRPAGSSGGQNGLASVIATLGSEEFPRLRLGIAPLSETVPPEAWADHVLSDFTSAEEDLVTELVGCAADALENWLARGLTDTISRFNRRIQPEIDDQGQEI